MLQQHKDVLKMLMPVDLGDTHEMDLAVEGRHLDLAQDSAVRLLANCFADSAFELLPSWERYLGIVPPIDASIQARTAACVLKLRELGGLSIPYFIQLAEAMGYEIIIQERWPFMAGVSGAGDRLYIKEIIWCWRVDVQNTETPMYDFRAGVNMSGDPLLSFGIQEIEALFNDLKPAHTFVYFTYPEV
jgi:uncharacterized protein YmfQ (DUF2313 family)